MLAWAFMRVRLYARESGESVKWEDSGSLARVRELARRKLRGAQEGNGTESWDTEKKYGALLEAIAEEADAIAMKYFRDGGHWRGDESGDGTVVTIADKEVEAMALRKSDGERTADGRGGRGDEQGNSEGAGKRRARAHDH